MKRISIIGSGSWGSAIAIHLAKKGYDVKIWSFAEDEIKNIIEKRECIFLPGIKLPDNIYATTNFEEALNGTDLILHVTPSKFVRETIKKYKEYVKNQPIVMCSKGFEASTLKTLDEVIKEELPNNKIAVLSGPSHAEEVAIEVPTALVVASEDVELCSKLQEVFASEKMRVYTSNDVKGVEIGASLKNIIAFCSGIANALELGDNTNAALITRGLAEITRLGVAMGGTKETFYGLTGLGDLIVTCGSVHSRNRKAGILIGKGYSLEETKKEVGMVIECIDNIEIAYKLSDKYNIEMPIVDSVYSILYKNLEPKEAVKVLMTRKLKSEKE